MVGFSRLRAASAESYTFVTFPSQAYHLWMDRAAAAYAWSEWQLALNAYQQALEVRPRSGAARLGATWCRLALGEYGQALTELGNSDGAVEQLFARALGEICQENVQGIRTFERALLAGRVELSPTPPAPAVARALEGLDEMSGRVKQELSWTCRAVLLEWLGRGAEAFACLGRALDCKSGYRLARRLQDHWLSQLVCLPEPRALPSDRPAGPAQATPADAYTRPAWYREHLLGDDAQALFQEAHEAHRRGRLEDALEFLRRLSLVDCDHLGGSLLRFEVLLDLEQFDLAQDEGYHLMDLLEATDRLSDALDVGARLYSMWADDERVLRKHQLLYHRAGDIEQTTRWTFELVRRYRMSDEADRAAGTLYWLLRQPLAAADRLRVELQLLAILLSRGRYGPALDRLEVLLAQWELAQLCGELRYSRRAQTVLRLLDGAERGLDREAPRAEALRERLCQLSASATT